MSPADELALAHEEHEGGSAFPYVVVFLALLALTALTVFAAAIDLGPWNVVLALGIATTKAALVVLIFMHVRFLKGFMRVVVASGFVWFGIFVLLTLGDVLTRGWLSGEARTLPAEVPPAVVQENLPSGAELPHQGTAVPAVPTNSPRSTPQH